MSRGDVNKVEKQTMVLIFSRTGRLSHVDHIRRIVGILKWVEEGKT